MSKDYVFISYANKDKKRAYAIRDFLVDNGIHVWEESQLLQDDIGLETIAKKILGSNIVIAVISSASIDSVYCTKELKYALTEGKVVIPVFIENVEMPAKIRLLLSDMQNISLHDFESNHETREHFLDLIREII